MLRRHAHPARLQLVLPSPRAGGDWGGDGVGMGAGGQPGARAPQGPSTATAWDFLPGPRPHLGRALCPLLPSSCGDVPEGPAGSEVGHVPPAFPPCTLSL